MGQRPEAGKESQRQVKDLPRIGGAEPWAQVVSLGRAEDNFLIHFFSGHLSTSSIVVTAMG